ncbi:MAG TPA: glycosyltransferase [Planctomycetota bacterium]|nr:glycosyltransferase [Planctomycetota bacterium]HRT93267.1 glycosyltransferase [Planctomycetota bacterium]
MTAPAVTVLMSVHNGEAFLRQAVDSILAQTFRDFEFLIVDDGSTDGTGAILRSYSDPRVVVVRNDRCLTLPVSLNRGLRAARAPLVARADADDVYVPTRLARQVSYMERSQQIGASSAAFWTTDEKGGILERHSPPCRDEQIRLMLLWTACLSHPLAIFRRELVLTFGGYDERFWVAQDYDLWARLRDHTIFGNLSAPLMRHRSHPRSSAATRGLAGRELGCSVSRRLMSRYLGRELGGPEAAGLRWLLCGHGPIKADLLPLVLSLLAELLLQARARESSSTFAWLRRAASASLLQQSIALVRRNSAASRRLFWRALRLWPPRMATLAAVKQVGRLLGIKRAHFLPAHQGRSGTARHTPTPEDPAEDGA